MTTKKAQEESTSLPYQTRVQLRLNTRLALRALPNPMRPSHPCSSVYPLSAPPSIPSLPSHPAPPHLCSKVDYMERFSAAGATASGYSKRDGRPRDAETLTARPGPSGTRCPDSNPPSPNPAGGLTATELHDMSLWLPDMQSIYSACLSLGTPPALDHHGAPSPSDRDHRVHTSRVLLCRRKRPTQFSVGGKETACVTVIRDTAGGKKAPPHRAGPAAAGGPVPPALTLRRVGDTGPHLGPLVRRCA